MVKFPLKFFYNIGVISEILELPRFCPDFLQKKFYNIKPREEKESAGFSLNNKFVIGNTKNKTSCSLSPWRPQPANDAQKKIFQLRMEWEYE